MDDTKAVVSVTEVLSGLLLIEGEETTLTTAVEVKLDKRI